MTQLCPPLPYSAKPAEISRDDERLWRARLELQGETDAQLGRPALSALPDYLAGYRRAQRQLAAVTATA